MLRSRTLVLLSAFAVFALLFAPTAVADTDLATSTAVACAAPDGFALDGDDQRFDAQNCSCPTHAPPITKHAWACGNTCAEAQSSCQSQVETIAENHCNFGVCDWVEIRFSVCKSDTQGMCAPGQVAMDCEQDFRCLTCFLQP